MTTYRYTGDGPQPYPGYFQMFPPEDPDGETLCSALVGRPGHTGYEIATATCKDPLGNALPQPPIPPNDGRWAEEVPQEGEV